jgi:hypothetical protein
MFHAKSDQGQSQSYFRLAGEQERLGRLDLALCVLDRALQDPTRDPIRTNFVDSIERILRTCAARAKSCDLLVEPVHENSNNPGVAVGAPTSAEARPIVSLTTISTRIERVAQTIESLVKQTLQPYSVNLYISETPYLLDKGIDSKNENLQRIIDLGANVYMTSNIGPYRKQCPIVRQLKTACAAPGTLIVTADDDVFYPPEILERLAESARLEDAVVAHRGREIVFNKHRLAPYGNFGIPTSTNHHLNIATGKNGIAYRLKHFPDDPTEYVGPYLAPTADDIWCKWVTGIQCIPTIILEPSAAYDPRLDFLESAPLDKNGLFHVFNAKGANDGAMLNMESFFLFHRGVNLSSIYGRANK